VRFALVLFLVAACDLQPPKREAPKATEPAPAPAAAPTAQLPVQPPPVAVAIDAGAPVAVVADAAAAAPPPVEPIGLSKECTDVAVHIAEQVIKSVTDPAQKAALEQDRTKLVRRAGETCTRDKWSEAARKCFLAANSKDSLEACGKQLAPP
jgi:hypothetical protein